MKNIYTYTTEAFYEWFYICELIWQEIQFNWIVEEVNWN